MAMANNKSEVRISEYKGSPIISIVLGTYTSKGEEKENLFSFGLTKAQAILDNIEAIKRFVEENKGGR